MVPRPVGVGSPQCARCGKSVFMAEQVIGPYSKPYHKSCLTCTVCNKRLDSTLLVEHEGDPYCRNCHKAHLGQGKGGFGLSVPLRPEKPVALQSKPSKHVDRPVNELGSYDDEEDRLNEKLSGISISSRPVTEHAAPSVERPLRTTPFVSTSRPTTVSKSIDDLVASGVDVPIPYKRSAEMTSNINKALYGTAEEDERIEERFSPRQASFPHNRSPSPPAQRIAPAPAAYISPPQTLTSRSPASPTREHFSTPIQQRETIGTIRGIDRAEDGLPAPIRKDPIALARERERGLNINGSTGAAKTYSPRTTPVSPSRARYDGFDGDNQADEYGYSPNSALTKMGLGSTVSAAAVGTPLCARCQRPVYFAEQKQAAGRKWHRACLRCDGCSTTLESGKMEEGPLSATHEYPTNVWCRTCYAKRFGPKGIGVAGMSLPEMMK